MHIFDHVFVLISYGIAIQKIHSFSIDEIAGRNSGIYHYQSDVVSGEWRRRFKDCRFMLDLRRGYTSIASGDYEHSAHSAK